MSGLFPRGFGSKPSAVSKTLFPASDSVDSSALDYFVTASHAGLSDISGTVTEDGGVLAYSITLPFSSDSDSWNLAVTGKDGAGKTFLSSDAVAVKASDSEKDISLSYAKDPSGDTGSVDFEIPISASGVHSVSLAFGTDPVQTLNDWGEAIVFRKSGVAPGAYAIKILFYSETGAGGDVLYVISETVNVYSNLTTSVPYGHAEYITSGSGFKQITQGMIDAMQSVSESGIWLGGSGPTGIAASDDNSGTKFKPVATLWRAVEIANALAAKDATKTYTINVQGDVRAGIEDEDPEIAAATKVVIKGTNSTSYWTISGDDGTGPRDSINSNSAAATFQCLAFDQLRGFEVAAGKVTINDCQVTNGWSDKNGIAGGITVDAGAEFLSEQGLKITACENSKANGGGGGIWCAGTLNLTGAEISACKASGSDANGGGIYIATGATATLDSCVIGKETADNTPASSSSACSNYAAKNGGGIYLEGTASLVLQNGTKVTYNYASSGGGVYNNGTLDISGATISVNGASDNGGGVYVASSKTATFSSGTIKANSALRGAGFYNAGTLCVYGSAVIGGASSAEGNKAEGTYAFGGGVFNTGNCCLGYSAWTDSSETPEEWTGSISANSSENNAGGVHNTSIFRMISGTIGGATDAYANTAANNGGGVYCGGTSVLNLSGSAAIPPSSSGIPFR